MMTIQTAERTAATRLRTIFSTDDAAPLALRTELFLIAHDDDTGRLHVNPRRLELALAGAVLLDLWLAGRIQIGWRCDVRNARWVADPGRITVLGSDPIGDPLADSALTMLNRTGAPQIGDVIRRLAATGLYERVRGDMIAAGILRRVRRRRFRLFRWSRAEAYQPVEEAYSVRVRTRLRNLVTGAQPSGAAQAGAGRSKDQHDIALSALVALLELMPYLYSAMASERVRHRLIDLVKRHGSTPIRDIADALNPKRAA